MWASRMKPSFTWTAALIILGWPPLVAVLGLAFTLMLHLVPPLQVVPSRTIGGYTGGVVVYGSMALTFVGMPILAAYYRAGFGRGFAAVIGGVIHMTVWLASVLYIGKVNGVILSIALDAVGACVCAVMLWRLRQAAASAHRKLMEQFD